MGVSMAIHYTARYSGNGRDAIDFQSVEAAESNTDVTGTLRLSADGGRDEAAKSAQEFLANVKHSLESESTRLTAVERSRRRFA